MGLGTPMEEPGLWALILLNVAAQLASAYDAQSHFYVCTARMCLQPIPSSDL